jgi:DinB superfamily
MEALNDTIIQWRKELENYRLDQLCAKPSPTAWSLGQLYRHLIEDTYFYLEQATIAASTEEHRFEEASAKAKGMFLENGFPDEQIEGAPDNAFIPQPESKQQLMNDLMDLKDAIRNVGLMISASPIKGKSKHPGLGYFSAQEWIQFADMHFRHHLRQKKRIDAFLRM